MTYSRTRFIFTFTKRNVYLQYMAPSSPYPICKSNVVECSWRIAVVKFQCFHNVAVSPPSRDAIYVLFLLASSPCVAWVIVFHAWFSACMLVARSLDIVGYIWNVRRVVYYSVAHQYSIHGKLYGVFLMYFVRHIHKNTRVNNRCKQR